METIDFQLLKNSNDIFDLVIENGEFKTINSFDTAIFMSLFCERRADESEQSVNFLRRGWWGNLLGLIEGFEIGSKLWLLFQSRVTQDTANFATTYAKDGLQWLVEDGFLDDILVTSQIVENDKVRLDIVLMRSNNVVDSRSFILWENTFKEVA